MKNTMKALGVGMLLGAIAGTMCLCCKKSKKSEKKGVRHAAEKVMDSLNELVDSIGKK